MPDGPLRGDLQLTHWPLRLLTRDERLVGVEAFGVETITRRTRLGTFVTHAVVALAGEATLVVVECDEASQATQWETLLQAELGGADAAATDRQDRAHGSRPTRG